MHIFYMLQHGTTAVAYSLELSCRSKPISQLLMEIILANTCLINGNYFIEPVRELTILLSLSDDNLWNIILFIVVLTIIES